MAGGWNIYGQLIRAQLELLSSAPASSLPGRVFHRTDLSVGEAFLDNGTLIKRFLLNDQGIIIGTSGTAATNVRANRSAAGKLQLLLGSDSTVEGTDSANLAELSHRLDNYATGSIPAAASARLGQLVYDTTLNVVKWCNGSTWVTILSAATAPTVQKFTSGTSTYTTPAGVLYIRVRLVGGGGGGGAVATNAGGDGGPSYFRVGASPDLLVGNGGKGGATGGNGGGDGGTASLGSGPVGLALPGSAGGGGWNTVAGNYSGGVGGASAFGGAGKAATAGSAGGAGGTNTGGGGGGGSQGAASGAGGGGAGGFVDAIITSPSATYAYSVGAAGAAGAAGTQAGGAGGSGIIIVEEYYQ